MVCCVAQLDVLFWSLGGISIVAAAPAYVEQDSRVLDARGTVEP